jgi:hypothetical protein
MRIFKGGEPNERGIGKSVVLDPKIDGIEPGVVRLPYSVMAKLDAEPGDLLYIADRRWWLGGLRSVHVRAGKAHGEEQVSHLSGRNIERGNLRTDRQVRVEKTL